MQRRSLPHRALALVLAIWFTVAFTGVTAMHRCPQHDGMTATPMGARTPMSMPMSMPMPAGGHASTSHGDGAHHAPARHDGGAQCTCFGQCCTACTGLVPAHVEGLAAALVPPAAPAFAPAATALPATQLRLPFANGPPHALRA